MKKNHPTHHTMNPEELYAKVNKTRKAQHPTHPEANVRTGANTEKTRGTSPSEETIYADINVGASGSRIRPEETIYADINVGASGSRTRPEETIYADINVGASGSRTRPEETVYADINVGASGSRTRPEETVYADVNVRERTGAQLQKEMAHAGARTQSTNKPLTPDYIAAQLLKDPAVQASIERTKEWSNIVYGNDHALDKHLFKILQDPKTAQDITWDIAQNPESPGQLAGKKILGIKNRERLHAEDAFSSLHNALEQYASVVTQAHKGIVQEHGRRHSHERGENREEQHLEHRAHRHKGERQQTAGEQDVQQQKQISKKGMAMAM
ncbi:BID domain-containing T4SS effector [Bartonella sp. B23]